MTIRTVVGLFRDRTEAEAAIYSLENDGFQRSDISLLRHGGSGDAVTQHSSSSTTTGAAIGGAAGAVLGLIALAIPGIGPVLALGPLAVALTGAGVGAATGGMLGALSDMGVPEHESRYYEDAIRQGGSLLVVHASVDTAERAQSILDRHGALGVHGTEEGGTVTSKSNFGEEGGSSQWSHTALTASGVRPASRVYPDNRGGK
jgi:uncharacterized membrane protein